MDDKDSAPSVIAAYRKRQERAQYMLLFFWIGVMLLVVGAGYLAYILLEPENPDTEGGLSPTVTATRAVSNTQDPLTGSVLEATPALQPGLGATPQPLAATESSGYFYYKIQEGDTLFSIAERFGVDMATLMGLNPEITPEVIKVGDELTIPGENPASAPTATPTTGFQSVIEYEVMSGDTLAGIAARFDTMVDAIVRENNLESPDQIREGQILRIPVANASPTQSGAGSSTGSETELPPTSTG
jgi:LysM repeat protein